VQGCGGLIPSSGTFNVRTNRRNRDVCATRGQGWGAQKGRKRIDTWLVLGQEKGFQRIEQYADILNSSSVAGNLSKGFVGDWRPDGSGRSAKLSGARMARCRGCMGRRRHSHPGQVDLRAGRPWHDSAWLRSTWRFYLLEEGSIIAMDRLP
jgi:hypothetical protein